ncbi:hypothetical protein DSO57_1029479 [Entomophthora muscae]|uniref:Uncharacterized protein n=1 Tax=Entomophthora muscae TaxID=34485 RepID=A0ACC2SQH8_9FUNG|nr:hypothetical protein DSO57_1029479 [Entomophthora muscae]
MLMTTRATKPKITNLGIKPTIFAGKQKHGRLRKPAGGFEPPTNHQGGCKPTLKREIIFNTHSVTELVKITRASLQTGPGGLAAPNSSRATSSNAKNELDDSHQLINDYCWVIQQIQYQLDLLNNLRIKSFTTQIKAASPTKIRAPVPVSSSSPDPHAILQPTHKFNATLPTDVMKHHLMEDIPNSPSN